MAVIKKQSMSAQVIDHILSKIEGGELKPGDKLMNERDFAESLGISRVPLREAICALTALGILTSRQGDGTFVNSFNEGMLGRIMYIYTILDEVSANELMELRADLEASCAAAAAERRSEEEISRIRDAQKAFADALEGLKNGELPIDRVFAADHAFHKTIGRAAGNKLYNEILGAIRVPFERYPMSPDPKKNIEYFNRSLEHHRGIVEAIEKGERLLAYDLMQKHIEEVLQEMQEN